MRFSTLANFFLFLFLFVSFIFSMILFEDILKKLKCAFKYFIPDKKHSSRRKMCSQFENRFFFFFFRKIPKYHHSAVNSEHGMHELLLNSMMICRNGKFGVFRHQAWILLLFMLIYPSVATLFHWMARVHLNYLN